MLVYHPVTFRSRVGWEAARILAARGAFRLRRGYSLLPREVWEAASPLIPEGGGLSVSRANHPGRFLALVCDGDGRPLAFIKVARDAMGSRALAAEHLAIERFAPHLPRPLFAPRVVDQSEGVLVIEAVEWAPRAAPWRLTEEVAFALGAFFRRTSETQGASGAAHGDFAPWNLLRTADGWGVVDWEDFRAEVPPYFDLFHYVVQSNIELRRPLRRTILNGLAGRGWVAGAIDAYAAGADVDVREGTRFLREYLHISAAELDRAPRRSARVRSRMLQLLEG